MTVLIFCIKQEPKPKPEDFAAQNQIKCVPKKDAGKPIAEYNNKNFCKATVGN